MGELEEEVQYLKDKLEEEEFSHKRTQKASADHVNELERVMYMRVALWVHEGVCVCAMRECVCVP